MEIWHILIGQALQLVATVAVLKTDNQWFKGEIKRLSDWVLRVEAKADEALKR
ncbi:MAG: hypothetical protein ABNH42_19800 [Marinobacter sp.]